jgi:hypothetical protein
MLLRFGMAPSPAYGSRPAGQQHRFRMSATEEWLSGSSWPILLKNSLAGWNF